MTGAELKPFALLEELSEEQRAALDEFNMEDFEASASASFTKPRHRRDGVITSSYAHRWMEPDGEHPISDANRRLVIRQVTKLVSGEGVHYDSVNFGWPDDVIFRKDEPVTMQLNAVPNQNSELHAIDATIFTQVGHRPDHRGRARVREHARPRPRRRPVRKSTVSCGDDVVDGVGRLKLDFTQATAGSSTTRSASSSSTSTTSTRRRGSRRPPSPSPSPRPRRRPRRRRRATR